VKSNAPFTAVDRAEVCAPFSEKYADLSGASTGKALYAFLGSVDILSFGEIGLLAYGFSKVTKSSFFFGVFSVGSLWAIYVVVKVGLSLLR
jgi:hypothetical protein